MNDYEREFYKLALLVSRAHEALQYDDGQNHASQSVSDYLSEAKELVDSVVNAKDDSDIPC